LAGISILKPFIIGGDLKFKRIKPDRFFFDKEAINFDLSDAQYWGEWDVMIPSQLFEIYPNMTEDARKRVENCASYSTGYYNFNGRVVVYSCIWRDCVKDVFGYIRDEFDDIQLIRVNHIYENERKPRYTEKDLLKNSELTDYQRKVLKIKPKDTKINTGSLIVEQLRYCDFIPGEIVSSNAEGNNFDVILEYGVLPYQEEDLYNRFQVRSPYKCYCWSYLDGEILSPVDAAINPQRLINRFLSVSENLINNAGGSGVVIDQDAVDDPYEAQSAIKRGDALMVRSKGLGVPNIVTPYDASPGRGASTMIEFANIFKGIIESSTGVNESLKGQAGSSDQLVGLTQLMIQRGSVLQEPFYKAIEEIYLQAYQHIATVGKRIYIDNNKKLVEIVGSEDAEVLSLTPDMKNESFRVIIERVMDRNSEIKEVNQYLIQMMAANLLDQYRVAMLYNRATNEDMANGMREFAKEKKEAEKQQVTQQQEQQQQMMQEQQQMMQQQSDENQKNRDDAMLGKQLDHQNKLESDMIKSYGKKNNDNQTVI
jgi:hypothetical protein